MIKKFLNNLQNKHLILRLLIYVGSCFFLALNYNLFIVPNQLVSGGMSGLAIIFKELFNWSIPLFLNISTIILFIISYFMLDWKKTLTTFCCGLFYNYMVLITAPLAAIINIQIESTFLMLLVVSSVYGIFFGLVYRTGWNTGGSDTILVIMKEYLKMPMGTAGTWFNIFIVCFGLIVFGPIKTICAVFVLLLNNKLTDNVTLGVKGSKMCFVKSAKNDAIQDYILTNRNLGVTELVSKGGIFTREQDVLLVIVPTDEYYGFKHIIKKMDSDAFILTTDCYAVSGGYKKQIIPF